MNAESGKAIVAPDTAAVFSIALSLWKICEKSSGEAGIDISECYNGWDQLMREAMRVANQFENWACCHVNFAETSGVWPYYLADNFGTACMSILPISCLTKFGERDCLSVAMALRLPIICADGLPVPVDLTADNPVTASDFSKFRIQTMRDSVVDDKPTPYVFGDKPFDEDFGEVYFSLYGVAETGLIEHIADRKNYRGVLELVQKLVPSIAFPELATSCIR